MADNLELNAGSGGDTIAADDIGGIKHQRVKVQHGADGAATDVSAASPLPVDLRADNVGGIEVLQDTAADLNVTEASATDILTAVQAIQAAVELLDNAISGSEMQADIVTLPSDVAAADAQAYGKGILVQGDDGADRRSLRVDTDGHPQVDVVAPLPAGANTVGGVISAAQSSIVYDGTTACTVKRFHVVTSTSGTAVIPAPAGGKKVRCLSLAIIGLSATATNVHLETGTTNTDCFGDGASPVPVAVDADGDNMPGIVLGWNAGGWFETADADESVEIVLSAAQPVLVCGNYIEVS